MDAMGGESMYELRFRKEAQFLRDGHGIGMDDLTAVELAALVHAVERVCSPFSDVNAELAERPVPVCRGVWFWRPTAGAQMWLDEYAARWWPKGTLRWKWAQVYALKNARDAEAFAPLTKRWRAERAIVMCALRLPVHGAELQDALNRAYGVMPHDAPRGRRTRAERMKAEAQTDFASIVARLEVESGIPRDTWLWGRSLAYALDAYVQMHQFAAAFSMSGGERTRMRDELDDALRNLAAVKDGIVRGVRERRLAAGRAEAHGNAPSGAPKDIA